MLMLRAHHDASWQLQKKNKKKKNTCYQSNTRRRRFCSTSHEVRGRRVTCRFLTVKLGINLSREHSKASRTSWEISQVQDLRCSTHSWKFGKRWWRRQFHPNQPWMRKRTLLWKEQKAGRLHHCPDCLTATERNTSRWFLLLKWWPLFHSLLKSVPKCNVLHGGDGVAEGPREGERRKKEDVKSFASFKNPHFLSRTPHSSSEKKPNKRKKLERIPLSAEKHPVHL